VRKVGDAATRRAVIRALKRIAPALLASLPDHLSGMSPASETVPPPASKRHAAWQRCVEAARSLQQQEDSLRLQIVSLLDEGFFAQERDLTSLQTALADREHPVDFMQLFLPLLNLTTEGVLVRRKGNAGKWLYAVSPLRQRGMPSNLAGASG